MGQPLPCFAFLIAYIHCSEWSDGVRHVDARLWEVQRGDGRGVVEVQDDGAEALRVGVGDGGDGENEGHNGGGPGKLVIGGKGKMSHTRLPDAGCGPNECGVLLPAHWEFGGDFGGDLGRVKPADGMEVPLGERSFQHRRQRLAVLEWRSVTSSRWDQVGSHKRVYGSVPS